MTSSYTPPSGLILRRARSEDDGRIIAIHNAIYADMPPMSVEEYRQWMTNRPLNTRLERCVAEMDGEIAGSFDLAEATWVKRPGTWLALGEVDAPYRRRGIGSTLYNRMMELARSVGAQRIYSRVRENMPDSICFVEHRGFLRSGSGDRMSRLKVGDANLAGFEGVEKRLGQEGIRIATLAEIGVDDENFLRALHEMEGGTVGDIPSAEQTEIDPYEVWYARVVKGVGRSPNCFWIALHGGRPVGVARLTLRGEQSALNGLTGVDRTYRGRGIARALKMRTIQWACQNGIKWIYTGNDLDNHRMLSINISLGYQPLPAEFDVVKELATEHSASI